MLHLGELLWRCLVRIDSPTIHITPLLTLPHLSQLSGHTCCPNETHTCPPGSGTGCIPEDADCCSTGGSCAAGSYCQDRPGKSAICVKNEEMWCVKQDHSCLWGQWCCGGKWWVEAGMIYGYESYNLANKIVAGRGNNVAQARRMFVRAMRNAVVLMGTAVNVCLTSLP